jgi:Tfp pilus assembly protein PilE
MIGACIFVVVILAVLAACALSPFILSSRISRREERMGELEAARAETEKWKRLAMAYHAKLNDAQIREFAYCRTCDRPGDRDCEACARERAEAL